MVFRAKNKYKSSVFSLVENQPSHRSMITKVVKKIAGFNKAWPVTVITKAIRCGS